MKLKEAPELFYLPGVDKEGREAIWQYLIDHSRVKENGYYSVYLTFKDRSDFWRRIDARRRGFHRYDIEKKEYLMATLEIKKMRKLSQRNSEISARIDKSGTLRQKFLLWCYRVSRRTLFGK